MKKTYETPVAEKIEFCYEDQIVASGGTGCQEYWVIAGVAGQSGCEGDGRYAMID